MKNQTTKKSWPTIVGIIIVALIVYFMFFAGAPDPADQSLLQDTGEGNLAAAQVLGLLNQIQSLRINEGFFQNPAYRSLLDYTVAIPPEGVGRDNPFAPIP